MRKKIGPRLDDALWSKFESVCRAEGLLARDVLEKFLSCIAHVETTTILSRLETLPTGELSKLELEVETKLFLLRRNLNEEPYPVGLASNLEELYKFIPRLPEGYPLIQEITKFFETVKNTHGQP